MDKLKVAAEWVLTKIQTQCKTKISLYHKWDLQFLTCLKTKQIAIWLILTKEMQQVVFSQCSLASQILQPHSNRWQPQIITVVRVNKYCWVDLGVLSMMDPTSLCLSSQSYKTVCQLLTTVKEITCKLLISCHLLLSIRSKECRLFQWLLHHIKVWINKTCRITCTEIKLSLITSSSNRPLLRLQLIKTLHLQFICHSHSMLTKVFKTNNLSNSTLHPLINKISWCSHSSSNMLLCNINSNSCSNNNSSSNSKTRHLQALVDNSKVNNSSIWIRCESIYYIHFLSYASCKYHRLLKINYCKTDLIKPFSAYRR